MGDLSGGERRVAVREESAVPGGIQEPKKKTMLRIGCRRDTPHQIEDRPLTRSQRTRVPWWSLSKILGNVSRIFQRVEPPRAGFKMLQILAHPFQREISKNAVQARSGT
jgi:hypothetical protein